MKHHPPPSTMDHEPQRVSPRRPLVGHAPTSARVEHIDPDRVGRRLTQPNSRQQAAAATFNHGAQVRRAYERKRDRPPAIARNPSRRDHPGQARGSGQRSRAHSRLGQRSKWHPRRRNRTMVSAANVGVGPTLVRRRNLAAMGGGGCGATRRRKQPGSPSGGVYVPTGQRGRISLTVAAVPVPRTSANGPGVPTVARRAQAAKVAIVPESDPGLECTPSAVQDYARARQVALRMGLASAQREAPLQPPPPRFSQPRVLTRPQPHPVPQAATLGAGSDPPQAQENGGEWRERGGEVPPPSRPQSATVRGAATRHNATRHQATTRQRPTSATHARRGHGHRHGHQRQHQDPHHRLLLQHRLSNPGRSTIPSRASAALSSARLDAVSQWSRDTAGARRAGGRVRRARPASAHAATANTTQPQAAPPTETGPTKPRRSRKAVRPRSAASSRRAPARSPYAGSQSRTAAAERRWDTSAWPRKSHTGTSTTLRASRQRRATVAGHRDSYPVPAHPSEPFAAAPQHDEKRGTRVEPATIGDYPSAGRSAQQGAAHVPRRRPQSATVRGAHNRDAQPPSPMGAGSHKEFKVGTLHFTKVTRRGVFVPRVGIAVGLRPCFVIDVVVRGGGRFRAGQRQYEQLPSPVMTTLDDVSARTAQAAVGQ